MSFLISVLLHPVSESGDSFHSALCGYYLPSPPERDEQCKVAVGRMGLAQQSPVELPL